MKEEFNKKELAFIAKLRKRVVKAICKYNLIEEGDRVVIAVSGGKDSLVLLDLLGQIKAISKINFDLIAVHINVANVDYQIDYEYVNSICSKFKIQFIAPTIHVEFDPEKHGKTKKKNNCFVCSWHRRKKLFDICKEYKCNKMALGHHMDDIVQTLLMNMCFNAAVKTMIPNLSMFDGSFNIIRPLALVTEDLIIQYKEIVDFKSLKRECPYEEQSNRIGVRSVIEELKKLNPNAINNIYASMGSVVNEYLPPYSEKI